jgi:hypothetical protein
VEEGCEPHLLVLGGSIFPLEDDFNLTR